MDEQPTPDPETILDQYKSYMVDVGNIGTRYTTSNGFYLSVITAFVRHSGAYENGRNFRRIENLSWPCRLHIRSSRMCRLAANHPVLFEAFCN